MFHKIGFEAKRDTAMVWKEHEKRGRILVEPPQFVWRKEKLPPDAEIVKEPT
jgi:hypothetical protein